jgi:hypothetical protein
VTMLTSLTVVSVVKDNVVDLAVFDQFIAVLEQQAIDFDFVLVSNAVNAELALRLKALVAAVPDTTVVFLGERVHDDLARLVGIEHAVGDYLLLCDMTSDDPATFPSLLAPLGVGYDLVIGDTPGSFMPTRSVSTRILYRLYIHLYAAMTGVELERRPTGLRVLSRSAALFLAGRPNSELLVRARNIGNGFPATAVTLMPKMVPPQLEPQVSHSWSKGIGMLLSVSTMPLRGASYSALLGGVLSILYSFYVFSIYLFKPDVANGWTTISLQLAGMMFIFSVVLLFISEYIIQIHSASPPRSRRYLVLRELRSTLSRRSSRLNIVDAEGRFQVGQPRWLLPADGDRAQK